MTEYILENQKLQLYNDITKFVENSRIESTGDVVIKCYDGDVYSHSVVLALYSSLFRYTAMYSDDDIVVYAQDYSLQSVGHLLTLLYLGKVELIDEETRILSELCDMLGKTFFSNK